MWGPSLFSGPTREQPVPWGRAMAEAACCRLPEQRGRMRHEKLLRTPQSCQPQMSHPTANRGQVRQAFLTGRPRLARPLWPSGPVSFSDSGPEPGFQGLSEQPHGSSQPPVLLPPVLLHSCHSGHSPYVGFVPCPVPCTWASLGPSHTAASPGRLVSPVLCGPSRPTSRALCGAHPNCTAQHFSPAADPGRVGAPGGQAGPRPAGTHQPASSLQPDLSGQRGKGQVLPVLHHGNGWRHEHLGREGES